MARGREGQQALDRVDAAYAQVGAAPRQSPARGRRVRQDVLRHRVEHGEHPGGGAQLTHRCGRPQPATHDVADHEGHPAAGERDDVEPVAADAEVPAARQVTLAVSTPVTRGCALRRGERSGRRPSPAPRRTGGVVQGEGRPGRDLLGQGDVGRVVGGAAGAPGPPRRRRAPGRGPATARRAGSGRPAAHRRPPDPALTRPPPRSGRVGHPLVPAEQRLRVGDIHAGDPERIVLSATARARGGTGSPPGRRAPCRPGPAPRCEPARGRRRAGPGCRTVQSWPRREAGAGPRPRAPSLTPSRVGRSPDADDQDGSVPVLAIPASWRTICSGARGRAGERAYPCGLPRARAGVRPSDGVTN